jgi:hypothetical protein
VIFHLVDYTHNPESIYIDESTKKLDHDTCQEFSRHLIHTSGLPAECKKFEDVVTSLKRHDTDTAHPTQWLG